MALPSPREYFTHCNGCHTAQATGPPKRPRMARGPSARGLGPNHFFTSAVLGRAYPGAALKLDTGLPVAVWKTLTSPLPLAPATRFPSGLMATAKTQSVNPPIVLLGVPATGVQVRIVFAAVAG